MNVLAPYDVEGDRGFREGQRWPWILLSVIVLVLLLVAAAIVWMRNQVDPPGEPGREIRVRIE